MNVNIRFMNIEQEKFFYSTARNNCFSGGFGNGKSWVACARQFIMLQQFPGYVSLFARKYYKELKNTTMKTFFKICPQDFVLRHDLQEGITVFKNGSVALWMHLDAFDEQSLRGLEINSACLDQVEEIDESIYLVLDARIGRWDGAKVPESLLLSAVPPDLYAERDFLLREIAKHPKNAKLQSIKDALLNETLWPKTPTGDRFRVRNFMDVLCNPEDEYHWVYRRYHPDSIERKKNHFYIERATDEKLNDPDTIENMKDRDPEWVAKYYQGAWGRSKSQIHRIEKLSLIDPKDYPEGIFNDFIKRLLDRAALYRVLDHGESSPTCCLWFAALNNIHICYREYYVPNQPISFHRAAITELSRNPFTNEFEEYFDNIADPSIFHKTRAAGASSSKNLFKTSIADEYLTNEIDGPEIAWSPGDNNELATRNRINELLFLNHKYAHPISHESPAPGLYFIKKSEIYPYGCSEAIGQLGRQRRELIGSDNGRSVYSDDREEGVVDHAYDPIRYYVAEHFATKATAPREVPERCFANFERIRKITAQQLLSNH